MQNKYIIKIKIDNEDELYNKFDKSKETLSDELVSYINNKIELSEVNQKIIFEVDSKKDIDEEHLNNTFKNNIKNQIHLIDKKLKSNRYKEFYMFLLGIIFILLSIYFQNEISDFSIEILSIIGSFAIWEAIDSALLENKELKIKKTKLLQLLNTKVIEK